MLDEEAEAVVVAYRVPAGAALPRLVGQGAQTVEGRDGEAGRDVRVPLGPADEAQRPLRGRVRVITVSPWAAEEEWHWPCVPRCCGTSTPGARPC